MVSRSLAAGYGRPARRWLVAFHPINDRDGNIAEVHESTGSDREERRCCVSYLETPSPPPGLCLRPASTAFWLLLDLIVFRPKPLFCGELTLVFKLVEDMLAAEAMCCPRPMLAASYRRCSGDELN